MKARTGSISSTEETPGDPTLMIPGPPGSEDAALKRGQAVGRYMILDRVGAGGMAVVYAAYDPELDRKVAVKLLKHMADDGTLPGSRGSNKGRALREAQALAKLSHPNVLPIYDVGTVEGQVFLATELVEGKTLRDWLQESRRSWREVLRVFMAAGRGLAAAHTQGIVHRDFKPHNVMVGTDGSVRVMDFGLARRSTDQESDETQLSSAGEVTQVSERDTLASELTKTGVVAGTPVYMAPEQHDGMDVDARADQYSFCVALHEGLYGSRPFTRTSGQSALEAKRAHRLAPLSTAALRRAPRWIRKILVRGLAPDPDERWASMEALLLALSKDPRVRLQKWAAAGAVLTALAGGTAYGEWQQSKADRMCKGGEERIESIWNPDRWMEIEDSLKKAQNTGASSAWGKLRTGIDTYAKSWVDMHGEACEATHVLREQSEEIMDLRMSCLQQRFWDLESLLEVLSQADEEIAQNAVVAVSRLRSVEHCADLKALRTDVPPPESPSLQVEVEALQKRTAEVLAIYNTGNVSHALELAEELAKASESVDYPPVRADILARLGIFQQTAGLHREAEQTLIQAAWLATANRMFMVAARVEAYLVYVVGYALNRYEEGLQWAGHAEAILAAGGGDNDRASHIIMNRANVLFRKGDIEASYALQVEALRLREAHFGPDHPELIMTLSNAGALARNSGRSEEAVSYLQRAIQIGEQHLGADHPQLAFPLLNLGSAHMEKGDLDAADKCQTRAIEIWRQSTGPRNVHIAHASLRLSILREYQGRYKEAAKLVEQALDIRGEIVGRDHPQYADALRRMGEVREVQERHEDALDAYQNALAIFERNDPDSREVLHSQLGRGRTLVSVGRAPEAIEILETARERASALAASPEVTAEILFSLARAFHADGRTDRALEHANQALKLLRERPGFGAKRQYDMVSEWINQHR